MEFIWDLFCDFFPYKSQNRQRRQAMPSWLKLGSIWKPGIWPTARDFSPAEAIFPQEYFVYYKGKWCTAGGKDPLFGHVDGFQIDPISWAATHNSARSLRQDFCSNSKFRKWRNTVCISHFRNCGSGAKDGWASQDAIARCCPCIIQPKRAWRNRYTAV